MDVVFIKLKVSSAAGQRSCGADLGVCKGMCVCVCVNVSLCTMLEVWEEEKKRER